MKSKCLFITLGLGLGLTWVLLWSLSASSTPVTAAPVCRPQQAPGDVITVCLSGGCDYSNIQAAVDAADDGDVIKIATGVYTGVKNVPSLNTATFTATQLTVITKPITIRGGYTTTNGFADPPDPEANPTTLDAEGLGRVLVITGTITPTVEGLRITGGDARGLSGGHWGWPTKWDAGGGLYIYTATATISNCVVHSNTASTAGGGQGGGLYLHYSPATLSGNTVLSNTASTAGGGQGGGLYLHYSPATLNGNTVASNTASTAGEGFGGGLYLRYSPATLSGNTVVSNTASTASTGTGAWSYGGGLVLWWSDATLIGNRVISNTASTADRGVGGGLALFYRGATLIGNTVQSNTASTAGQGEGGGLYLSFDSAVTLNGNTIQGNTAGVADDCRGGGLFLQSSVGHGAATLNGNAILSNTATLSPTASGYGGGLWMDSARPFTLTNNLVADNHANTGGSGFWLENSYGRLLHTTIADNHGSGQGMFAGDYSTLFFTNTIIAGHDGMGISVATGSRATLEATLWYDNESDTDTDGWGTIVTGTINVHDDPAFVNPSAWDYHIGSGSAAIDKGVNAGVSVDIDGDSRPDGCFFDIGADEFISGVECKRIYLPLVLRNH